MFPAMTSSFGGRSVLLAYLQSLGFHCLFDAALFDAAGRRPARTSHASRASDSYEMQFDC